MITCLGAHHCDMLQIPEVCTWDDHEVIVDPISVYRYSRSLYHGNNYITIIGANDNYVAIKQSVECIHYMECEMY